MSKTLAMNYGTSGEMPKYPAMMRQVEQLEITDETVYTFTPEAGAMYIIFSKEYNASNGNFYGERAIVTSAPEPDKYGTTECNRGNMYASGNSGVTISYPSDSTITIKRSSSTYAVRAAIYRVF